MRQRDLAHLEQLRLSLNPGTSLLEGHQYVSQSIAPTNTAASVTYVPGYILLAAFAASLSGSGTEQAS